MNELLNVENLDFRINEEIYSKFYNKGEIFSDRKDNVEVISSYSVEVDFKEVEEEERYMFKRKRKKYYFFLEDELDDNLDVLDFRIEIV